jgi:hypothetical protein
VRKESQKITWVDYLAALGGALAVCDYIDRILSFGIGQCLRKRYLNHGKAKEGASRTPAQRVKPEVRQPPLRMVQEMSAVADGIKPSPAVGGAKKTLMAEGVKAVN